MKTVEERFWSKVGKTGGASCWRWLGAASSGGYGNFDGNISAHRFAWMLTRGAIPQDAHVLHRCDNPLCVNPAHLFLGSHADNMRDRDAKSRQFRGVAASQLRQKQNRRARIGYIGITRNRSQWLAQINVAGRRTNLGRYTSPVDAALIYDRAARAEYGKAARVNFKVDSHIESILENLASLA